jgi:hypothetical protein
MNRMLDQNVLQVRMAEDGTEIILTLVDAGIVPQETVLRCSDVIVLEWNRTPPDKAPYITPEIVWEEVDCKAIPNLLEAYNYRFVDWDGSVWHRFTQPLVHLKIEGAVCAAIICGNVDVQRG